jgi:hypothetical protein
MAGSKISFLPERGDVVKYPERTAMSTGHQVISMNDKIPNGRGWKVHLKALPVAARVEGNEHSYLGRGEQEVWFFGIFTHGVHDRIFG